MTQMSSGQFAANIQVAREPVQYRIMAGDAVTRKYTLEPRPRPHVLRFAKTYHYPPYTGLKSRTVTEENGDLEALEGSNVELDLEVDQGVKEAALRVEAGETKSEIILEPAGLNRLHAELPLTASGTYRVQLVASATGFENKFSPQYELRAKPDLVPSVKIERPEKENVSVPPEGVVELRATATDDLGLKDVAQFIQVNNGAWQPVPLTQNAGTISDSGATSTSP